jgi:pimeloyl-ACP methyl ester carboxylesterase
MAGIGNIVAISATGLAERRWARSLVASLSLVFVLASSPGLADEQGTAGDGSGSVKRENVVLLHGLGRSAANMWILKWRLQARGYRICNIGYDTRVQSIERVSDAVFESLSGCVEEGEPTHFVTHSLGGLVLRSLLARHPISNPARAVMLAPPNQGSEIADWIGSFPGTEGLLGLLASQLGTGIDDLPRLLPRPSIPFGVIAGDRWINPVGPWLLPSPHDGTVSVASTRLEGMSDHLVLPHTHTFIMNSAEVAEQVDVFLRTGRFRREPAVDY